MRSTRGGTKTDLSWERVIPFHRDRLQAKLLCLVLLPPLAIGCLVRLWVPSTHFPLQVLLLSVVFAATVLILRAATPMASLSGAMICFLVTVGTAREAGSPLHSGLAPLTVLFLLTFVATRVGKRRKLKVESGEERRGRSAAQVLANLGMTGILVAGVGQGRLIPMGPVMGDAYSLLAALVLAALVEATADTVSSEIGRAFGQTAVMLTTMVRVPAGTDGAVSLLGTGSGLLGGALVAVVGMLGMRLDLRHTLFSFLGGTAALFFDSLLGATLERKGWLGNDLVNFFSTVFAVVVAWALLTWL